MRFYAQFCLWEVLKRTFFVVRLSCFLSIGTISTPNPASQTPDVLIQSTPPHRRARSPAWSYHFFADESSVELTITLPCAILLKEIQLQPHVSALCSKFIKSFFFCIFYYPLATLFHEIVSISETEKQIRLYTLTFSYS